jgi:hypothetical protein
MYVQRNLFLVKILLILVLPSGFKFSQLEMSQFSNLSFVLINLSTHSPSEVVLAVLLRSFVFEPAKDKEIKFSMGSIVWPRVVGSSGRAELPIKVSLVKS